MTTFIKNFGNKNIKVIYIPEIGIIRKITYNKRFYNYLINEINGIKHYKKKLKDNSINIINFYLNKNFSFVDQKIFVGNKNIFYKSLGFNFDIINRSINHYLNFWPKNSPTQVHGDLTIDNIIYTSKKIRFIDWELYGTSKEVWGYDLVYLVISSIFFHYYEKKKISNKDLKMFKTLWSKLRSSGINSKLLDNPISYFKKTLKKKNWIKVKKDHPGKIFIDDCDNYFIDIIKKLIHES